MLSDADREAVYRELGLFAAEANGKAPTDEALLRLVETERRRRQAKRIVDEEEAPEAPSWRRTSAAELLAAGFPEPVWVVPGLLPEGLCLFAARPKTGKSWLMLQSAVAMAAGGKFLRQQLTSAPVLYFALEDGDRRLARRLEALECPRGIDGLTFQFGLPWLGSGGCEHISGLVDELGPAMVVVDTLSKALDPGVDQDSNAQMTVALASLQRLALERHIAVVLVDHLRKSEGRHAKDVLTEVLGSTAKVGVADTIWGCYRKERTRRGELVVTGRDLEDANLVLDFTPLPTGWQLVGTAEDVGKSEAQQRYVEALDELGPATQEQVARFVAVTVQAASKVLRRLVDSGTVQVVSRIRSDGKRENVYASRSTAETWDGPWWDEH